MKFLAYFFAIAFLAACHGGGGHSPNSCADSGRGCPTTELRGNQAGHYPSDRNSQSRGDPDDRENDSNREPNSDRGGRPSRSAPRASSQLLKIILGNSGNISITLLDDIVLDSVETSHNNDVLTYNALGTELGLSYSDFGTYSVDAKDRSTNATMVPFTVGEESRLINIENIESDMHFTGQAVGNAHDLEHIVDLSGTATLAFDKESGTSTLGASFNNWYDIQVTDNGAIEFSNYTNKNNLVKLNATPDSDGVITDTGAKMDVGYYAPNPDTGVPTEATGLVQYSENPSGVQMDIAFGVK